MLERINAMRLPRRTLLQQTLTRPAPALLATALLPALAACGQPTASRPAGSTPAGGQASAPAGQPVRGGTYTEATFGDAKTVQPLLSQDTASGSFISNHYNAPLLRRNPDTLEWETKYGTAESYTLSPDGLTITFKLKPNLQWSDGRPITAQDYTFTFEKMMDPKVDFPYRSNYKVFESVTAPDDRTIVFKLSEPFCPAIDYTVIPGPIPKHVFENLDINDNELNNKPMVGSGPWLLQEWVKDDHATFVANDKFYLGRPNIDKYVIRIVADQNVVWAMLKAGEVDAGGIRAEDWEEAKTLKHLQLFNYYPPSASWVYIGCNLRNEILKDVRVRQAIAHALDRKKIIERIRLGHAKPMNTTYASASWAYTDDVPKFDYDPNRAKQLLEEAGWKAPPNDPNGTRVKDGKPLKMRIFYNAGNKEREQVATIAQQYAKAVGIELEVISEEWNAYLNRVNKTFDMELYVLGWSAGIEPNGFRNIWMTGGGQNSTGYSNPRVDELYPKAATVPGCKQEDRAKLYFEIDRIISQDQPYIFLWENEVLSGVNTRITVNKMTKSGYGYRPWEWYIKGGK